MPGSLLPIDIGKQHYVAASEYAYGERLENWYVESNPEGAEYPFSLYPTPGTALWKTVSTGGTLRGMKRMGKDLYVVVDNELWVYDINGTGTYIGSISGTRKVRMQGDGTHMGIATEYELFAANRSGVTLLSLVGIIDITYQDGFTIFLEGESQNVWFSDVGDMLTIGGTSFTQKDRLPDNNKAILMDHGETIVWGEESGEVLYNAGESPVPFVRVPQGFFEVGTYSTGSPAKYRNIVYWLGNDGVVYRLAGYTPEPISTSGIEALIDAQTEEHKKEAEGFIYSQRSHHFYVLNFPSLTLVFDIKEGRWHERSSTNKPRWVGQFYEKFAGKHLVTDYASNKILELKTDVFTDEGTYIRRRSDMPQFHGKGGRRAFGALYLDFEAGKGLSSGQGSDPQAMLDWTEDGGKSWSNELWESIGKIGENQHRAVWNQLGDSYRRRFRVTVTDPVEAILTGGYLSMEERE